MNNRIRAFFLILLIFILIVVGIAGQKGFTKLETMTNDIRLSLWNTRPTDSNIVIVAFDNSINANPEMNKVLATNSRETWAKIVNFIEKGNPSAILWNLNLSGYEDSSIASYSPDMSFANAIKKYDNIVLATKLDKSQPTNYVNPFPPASDSLNIDINENLGKKITYYYSSPIPDIFTDNAQMGVTNIDSDLDGVLRYSQLIYKIDKDGKSYYLPSVSFATFLKYIKYDNEIKFDSNKIIAKGHVIPVDKYGRTFINWRSAADISSYQYFPVSNILYAIYNGKNDFEISGKEYDNNYFKNKIVIVTYIPTNAQTLMTPIGKKVTSAEVNATLIDSYINDSDLTNTQRRKFPTKSPIWFDLLLIACTSYLLLMINLKIKNTKIALSLSGALIFLYIISGFALIFFPNIRLLIKLIYPIYIMLSILLVTYFYKLILNNQKKLLFAKVFMKSVSKKTLQNIIDSQEKGLLRPTNKKITIVYYDITSIIELQKTMPTELLLERLSEILQIIEKYTFKYNGLMCKFSNNTVTTYWGAPITTDKDGVNAVKAALEINQEIETINQKYIANNQVHLNLRTIINTQYSLVGLIKGENFYDYGLIGEGLEIVNLLNNISKNFNKKIILSQMTQDEVQDIIKTKFAGTISVYNEKIKVYVPEQETSTTYE